MKHKEHNKRKSFRKWAITGQQTRFEVPNRIIRKRLKLSWKEFGKLFPIIAIASTTKVKTVTQN